MLDEFDRVVGLDRLGSLHLNDSATPLGSNRDRHANIGEGELGESGCAAFLSEPRFEDLPCVLETGRDRRRSRAPRTSALRAKLPQAAGKSRIERRSKAPPHERTPDSGDALVVFGITGDLAKKMTLRSLYRLERRGLLECPVIGVAADDWNDDQLRSRARDVDRGDRRAARRRGVRRGSRRELSYVSGDFADEEHVRASRARRSATTTNPSSTWRSRRRCSRTVVAGLARRGLVSNGQRVVVEKPFGHDLAVGARQLAADLHQYLDESQLYRIDHFLGKMGLEEILYLRFANTMLEPVWNRNYLASRADHDGRELRGRGPRALLRPGRRAARRGRQPPAAAARDRRDGAAVRRRPRHAQGRQERRVPRDGRRPTRPTTCAASTTATARSTGSPPDSTTETYAALRLEIDNWRWAGVPFFIRTGKQLPVRQTELRLLFKHPPQRALHRSSDSRRPEPNQIVFRIDPAHRDPDDARRPARGPAGSRRDRARHGVRAGGRRGRRRPYEVLLHAALIGDTTHFTRQDSVEETWRIVQPLLQSPPRAQRLPGRDPGARGGARAGRRVRRLARALDHQLTRGLNVNGSLKRAWGLRVARGALHDNGHGPGGPPRRMKMVVDFGGSA